ncbi:FecR domain-containing protein [Tepidicaulis sp. LMO-SS28]|uniref:FecR domain-containing protein n=1 Tax=Tepidicaulis sp. LMO-SS28 TaxID=3447455 RepID=UPI003EE34921
MFSRSKHFSGFAFIAMLICLFVAPVRADELWRVEKVSGEVTVLSGAAEPAALTPARDLPPGSVVETGSTGRAVLSRGEEVIVVSPNSSISISPESARGMLTSILQRVGTILLTVDKKDRQHFEVETPYLAAVVKGTKFSVSVDGAGAAVHVMEGAVEVIDLDTGDVGVVRPGQTAQSFVEAGKGLSVSGPGAEPVMRGQEKTRARKVPPAKASVPVMQEASAGGVHISKDIGGGIDIAGATNGLARGAGQPAAVDGKGKAKGIARADEVRGAVAGNQGNAGAAAAAVASSNAVNRTVSASLAAPGNSGNAQGHQGGSPGNSGNAPGHNK